MSSFIILNWSVFCSLDRSIFKFVSLKFTFIPSSVHINPPLHTAQIAEYLRHPRSYVTSDQIPSSISSQLKALGFRRVEACRPVGCVDYWACQGLYFISIILPFADIVYQERNSDLCCTTYQLKTDMLRPDALSIWHPFAFAHAALWSEPVSSAKHPRFHPPWKKSFTGGFSRQNTLSSRILSWVWLSSPNPGLIYRQRILRPSQPTATNVPSGRQKTVIGNHTVSYGY